MRLRFLQFVEIGGRQVVFDIVARKIGIDHGIDFAGHGSLCFICVCPPSARAELVVFQMDHLMESVPKQKKSM